MFKQKERDQQEIAQDVLMREVSEDLRAQQLKEFWAKYGKLIYSLVLLIIISTVAFELQMHVKCGITLKFILSFSCVRIPVENSLFLPAAP